MRRAVPGIAITLGFIVLVGWLLDPADLLEAWRRLSPPAAVLGCGGLVLSYPARAFRIRSHFGREAEVSLWLCLKLTLNHTLINNVLPMRSGELSFPAYMWSYFGIRPERSVPILLWFRMLDLHLVLCLGAAAALWIATGAIAALLLLVVAAPAPLVVSPWLVRLAQAPRGRSRAVPRVLRAALSAVPADRASVVRAMGWTSLGWTCKLLGLAVLLAALTGAPPSAALLGVTFGELTSVLPIHSVGGFGTYEGGILTGLATAGVVPAAALAGAVSTHVLLLALSAVAAAAALAIPVPFRSKEAT